MIVSNERCMYMVCCSKKNGPFRFNCKESRPCGVKICHLYSVLLKENQYALHVQREIIIEMKSKERKNEIKLSVVKIN